MPLLRSWNHLGPVIYKDAAPDGAALPKDTKRCYLRTAASD
jgi:hypothetical protein